MNDGIWHMMCYSDVEIVCVPAGVEIELRRAAADGVAAEASVAALTSLPARRTLRVIPVDERGAA